MIDKFDLTDTSDLPKEIKSIIKVLNVRHDTMVLLELFREKDILSIDEIIVGLWRGHKIKKSRAWVSSTLYNLIRKNLIKPNKAKGTYEKGDYK